MPVEFTGPREEEEEAAEEAEAGEEGVVEEEAAEEAEAGGEGVVEEGQGEGAEVEELGRGLGGLELEEEVDLCLVCFEPLVSHIFTLPCRHLCYHTTCFHAYRRSNIREGRATICLRCRAVVVEEEPSPYYGWMHY